MHAGPMNRPTDGQSLLDRSKYRRQPAVQEAVAFSCYAVVLVARGAVLMRMLMMVIAYDARSWRT